MNPKFKNKKLIMPGAVLVVAVAAVVGYLTMFSKPSQADFKAANDQLSAAIRTRTDLNDPYGDYLDAIDAAYSEQSSKSAAADDVKEQKAAFDRVFDKYQEQLEELGSQKAFRNDEAKKAYDAFKEREEQRLDYITDYLDGYKLFTYATTQSCAKVYTASQASANAPSAAQAGKIYADKNRELSKPCNDDLNQLAASGNDAFAAVAKDYQATLKSRQASLDKAASLGNDAAAATVVIQEDATESRAALEAAGDKYTTARRAAQTEAFKDDQRATLANTLQRLAK